MPTRKPFRSFGSAISCQQGPITLLKVVSQSSTLISPLDALPSSPVTASARHSSLLALARRPPRARSRLEQVDSARGVAHLSTENHPERRAIAWSSD